MRPARELVLVVLVVALLSVTTSHAPACGPYLERAIFHFQSLPALEQKEMIAGRIGVVQPRYWRRFLLVAYRYMSGVPLSDGERAGFLDILAARSEAAPSMTWEEARKLVPKAGPVPRINRYRKVPGSEWQMFLNCPPAATQTAASTLADRVARFGADSPAVLSWVRAQDTVFSNCGDGAAVPEPDTGGLPEISSEDRAYQIAAAYFYSLNFGEAQRRFAEIAEDKDSPWRDIAPYLVARCLLRKATLDPRPGFADRDLLARAAVQLRAVIDDPSRTSLHNTANGLLRYVDSRLAPGSELARIAADLDHPSSGEEFLDNLLDFQILMDKGAGAEPRARDSELIDWIVTFQDQTPGALVHSLERWHATSRETWLVAALVKLPPGHAELEPLLSAAAAVKPESAAWATATYHRVRLLTATNRRDEARAVLDEALPIAAELAPPSAQNLLRGQRFALGTTRAEFLRYAKRWVVGIGDPPWWQGPRNDNQPPRQFDRDAVMVLNQGLPVAELAGLAAEESLSEPMRREVALLAFTRALLLDEPKLARKLARTLELQIKLPDDVDARRFETAFFLLRHPAFRPYLVSGFPIRHDLAGFDDYRDNWWCSLAVQESLDGWPFMKHQETVMPDPSRLARSPVARPAPFLSDAARERFLDEWRRLLAVGPSPNYLAAAVIDYARGHRNDARVPEALHLAVRATRFGCGDKETGKYSQRAYALLHSRYANSEWARKTKYWYK